LGRDDSVALLVGRNFHGVLGAEIEGRIVTLGNFKIDAGSGITSLVKVGAGSQVVPNSGVIHLLVGGDLEINESVHLMPTSRIVYKGSNAGMGSFDPAGIASRDATLDLSKWTNAFVDLRAKSTYWATLTPNGKASFAYGVLSLSAGNSNCVQIFNFESSEPFFVATWGQEFHFDSSLTGKTVVFNINADSQGAVRIPNLGNFKDPQGNGGFAFSTDLTASILWNFHDATDVTIGGGWGDGEFQGSILIPTPNSKFTMSVPGHSGRVIVNGDVIQNNQGSEFHNYEFDPPCDLPLPDICV
jgi:choice-of-anchor A domain-containing protein